MITEYLEQIKTAMDNIQLKEIGLYSLAIPLVFILGRSRQGFLEDIFAHSDRDLARQKREAKIQERMYKGV